ncbi:MAG: hypothetical protein ACTSU5_03490 [Promethearchaeota archaeon]
MLIGKRMVALFIMTIMSTATPAVYQKGIEPRVEGANCNIEITDIEYVTDRELTHTDVLTLKAYLRIENTAPTEVILSRLNLDMYHHSALRGRYELIGTFNTTMEYVVPAAKANDEGGYDPGYIDTSLDADGTKLHTTSETGKAAEKYTKTDAFAYITFRRLADYYGVDAPVYEALSDLIQRKYLNVMLKGDARIGPFTFNYQRAMTINLDVWDTDFVIEDIFPAIPGELGGSSPEWDPNTAANYDFNTLFFHLQTHNPSRIPLILHNYTFNLLDEDGNLLANGLYSQKFQDFYDPDLKYWDDDDLAWERKTISSAYGFDYTDYVSLPAQQWTDIIMAFNFTGFDALGNPSQILTENNLYKLVSDLFMEEKLSVQLQGTGNMILGTFERGVHIGLNTSIGFQKPFVLEDVKLYQKSITSPQPLMASITMGEVNATNIDIDQGTKMVGINYTTSLNFTNQYRFDINMLDSDCSVFRVASKVPDDDSGTHEFMVGNPDGSLTKSEKVIQRAERVASSSGLTDLTLANTELNTSTTTIKMSMYNEYNSSTFTDTSGLAWILKDYSINPQIMNLTDPIFLMDPNGIQDDPSYFQVTQRTFSKSYVDPMKVVRYLIQQGIDPLQLIREVNTTREIYRGTEGYDPLECSFFGTNTTYYGSARYGIDESEELPDTERYYSGGSGYFAQAQIITTENWTDYYNANGFYSSPVPRPINQYDIVQWDQLNTYLSGSLSDNHWRVWNQSDQPSYQFFKWYKGGIFKSNRLEWDKRDNDWASGNPDYFSIDPRYDDIVWRYHGNAPWGYRFDYENFERGYFAAIYPTGAQKGAFMQNFTIDPRLTQPDIHIRSVKIGVSYKFPANPGDSNAFALIGLGHYNQTRQTVPNPDTDIDRYQYFQNEDDETTGDYIFTNGEKANFVAGGSRAGWILPANGSITVNTSDWIHKTIDVTTEVTSRLGNYTLYGDNAYLNMEIMLAADSSQTNDKPVFFDDVTFQIEYERDNPQGKASLLDLWTYLGEHDGDDWYSTDDSRYDAGNMYKFLQNVNFNATKFMEFLNDDPVDGGVDPGSGKEINFLDFMHYDGLQPATMSKVFQEQYQDIQGTEPINFLEMLNDTKYYVPNPSNLNYAEQQPWVPYSGMVDTPFGPRLEGDEYWVLEDPNKASRELARALQENLFANGAGTFYVNKEAGEELWFMLDNLEVYLPWINLYLATHGWSNDDIWDLWEACGLGSETKSNAWNQYVPDSQYWNVEGPTGLMRFSGWAELDLTITRDLFFFYLHERVQDTTDFTYEFSLGQTMREGLNEIYTSLVSRDGNDVIIPNGTNIIDATPLIEHAGHLDTPSVSTFEIHTQNQDPTLAGVIDGTGTFYTQDYGLWIWTKPSSTSPALSGARNNTFFDSGNINGFNTAGAKKLVSLLRNDFKISDGTFLQTGGDPVGFFKFLDDWYYEGSNFDDYSSYELLNYENVKSTDFIDIITGYNWTSDTFDTNMNGRADDWRAPYLRTMYNTSDGSYELPDYGNWWFSDSYVAPTGSVDPRTDWGGWGTKIYDTRLFYSDTSPFTQYNGEIIWTDSPDFQYGGTDQKGADHRAGKVYLDPGTPENSDQFWGGAPPIVNLIDMLAWLSRITGTPDPDTLLRWLTVGSTPGTKAYEIRDRSLTGQKFDAFDKQGLGVDGVYSMFDNMTMNTTGMINWVENVKYLDGFEWLYRLQQEDNGALDPLHLIDFVTHPNIALYSGGTYGFLYRPSFGTSEEQVPVRVDLAGSANLTVLEQESMLKDLLLSTDQSALHVRVTRPAVLYSTPTVENTAQFTSDITNVWQQNLETVDGLGVEFTVQNEGMVDFELSLNQYATWDDGGTLKLIKGFHLGAFIRDQPATGGGDNRSLEIYDRDAHNWVTWYVNVSTSDFAKERWLPSDGPALWFYPNNIGGGNAFTEGPGNTFNDRFCSGTDRVFRVRMHIVNDGLQETYNLDTLNATGSMLGYMNFEALVPDDGMGFLDWKLDIDGSLNELFNGTDDYFTVELYDIRTGEWVPWYDVNNDRKFNLFVNSYNPVYVAGGLNNFNDNPSYQYTRDNLLKAGDGNYALLMYTGSGMQDAYANFELAFPNLNEIGAIQDLSQFTVKIRMDQNASAEIFNGGEVWLQIQQNPGAGPWINLQQLYADQSHDVLSQNTEIWKTYNVPLSAISLGSLSSYLEANGDYQQMRFRLLFHKTQAYHTWGNTRIDYVDLIPGAYDPETTMKYIGEYEGNYYDSGTKVYQFCDRTTNVIKFRLTFQSDYGNFDNVSLDAVKFTVVKMDDEDAWKLFNGSWWAQEKHDYTWWPDTTGYDDAADYFEHHPEAVYNTLAYKFFERYHELEVPTSAFEPQNLAYNYFRILEGLYVDQVSWMNKILQVVEHPLEFLAATEIIDYDALIEKAEANESTSIVKLNGTISIELYGKTLQLQDVSNFDFTPQLLDLSATYHMRWTFYKDRFTNDNFLYHY